MAIPLLAPQAPPEPAARLAEDHALLCRAVRAAGALALGYFRSGAKHWEKAPGDPVSEADLAVDSYLRRALLGERPGYGWLSEESAGVGPDKANGPVWIVDPIDGTRAFVRGRPEFAVAAALVVRGCPRAAAVFNPVTSEFFDAVEGGGARCNGERLRVSPATALTGERLLVSRREYEALSADPRFQGCAVEPLHSIAYKLALVAAGRAAAVVCRRPVSVWDLAAADLLVAEAGGRVSDAAGGDLRYDRRDNRHPGVVAANPVLHPLLVERLARL